MNEQALESKHNNKYEYILVMPIKHAYINCAFPIISDTTL